MIASDGFDLAKVHLVARAMGLCVSGHVPWLNVGVIMFGPSASSSKPLGSLLTELRLKAFRVVMYKCNASLFRMPSDHAVQ